MLSNNAQPRQNHLNGSIHTLLDNYDGMARTLRRPQAEEQSIHAHVHEYNPITPKNSIEADQTTQVHVRWSMYGDLNPFITGTWHVSAYLESLQLGKQQRIPLTSGTTIALTPRHGPVDYEAWVQIPADTVTFAEDERTKSYKLVVAVTYHAPMTQPVPLTSGVADLAFQSHYLLVTPLTYRAATGLPGGLNDIVDGPELQFYIVV